MGCFSGIVDEFLCLRRLQSDCHELGRLLIDEQLVDDVTRNVDMMECKVEFLDGNRWFNYAPAQESENDALSKRNVQVVLVFCFLYSMQSPSSVRMFQSNPRGTRSVHINRIHKS